MPASDNIDWAAVFCKRRQIESELTPDLFFAEHPRAAESAVAAVEIIYHYILNATDDSANAALDRLKNAYPKLRSKLEIVFECDELLRDEFEDAEYPDIGELYDDFQLVSQLGQGANGRVYLASQPSLSDRYVALKLSPLAGTEHLSLARLQHSAIVPLLFASEDEERRLRVLVMPFFGGVTLHDAIVAMSDVPLHERKGKHIADCVGSQDHPKSHDQSNRPALRFIESATYESAVCWIVACLAEALDYAHQRGLGHFDVKPSNVLLASDGQPMLLDFHLARELDEVATCDVLSVGGTPGYMAPEQRAYMHGVQTNSLATHHDFDHRADIFAIGLVLRDLLSGVVPPAVETRSESPGRGRDVSTNLSFVRSRELRELLRSCLAPSPQERMNDAGDLANRLRRIAFGAGKPTKRRSYKSIIAFVAGGILTASAMLGIEQFRKRQIETPPNTNQTQDLKVIEQLHLVVRRVNETRLLQHGSQSDKEQLLRTARQLLAKEGQLLRYADQASDPVLSAQVRHDLESLEVMAIQLSREVDEQDVRRLQRAMVP